MFERKAMMRGKLTALTAVAALCLFSSCAHKDLKSAGSDPALAEGALLDPSAESPAASAERDAALFADLNTENLKKTEAALTVDGVNGTGDAAAVAENDGAYYEAKGGESLANVGHALYGSRYVKKLLEKNPGLRGVKRLSAGQKVYFDLATVRPQPTLLPRDLVLRYGEQLSERLKALPGYQGGGRTVTLEKGETLQAVSRRLYGTNRYWAEIYLLNRDRIPNFDRVDGGTELSIMEHARVANVAAASNPRKSPQKVAKIEPAPKVDEPAMVPVISPAAAVTVPPAKPEPVAMVNPTPVNTQPVVEPAPAPPVASQPLAPAPALDPIPETPAPAPATTQAKASSEGEVVPTETSTNANFRRILYVVLILGIGGGAYYFTRPKKGPKFDMLDVTTSDTSSRPKLTPLPKESQKNNIG